MQSFHGRESDIPESGKPLATWATLAELKLEFRSIPAGNPESRCPNCGGRQRERDRVGAGLSSFDVTTLYYCDSCGHFEIGETYWTSDY
jgi:hypothetical protein